MQALLCPAARLMLDVNTPKGKVTQRDEARADELFKARFPRHSLLHTPRKREADYDGLIYVKGSDELCGIAETKCRYDMNLDTFVRLRKSEWLITADKISRCRKHAVSMCVPLIGLLYFVLDDILLVQRILHADGRDATRIYERVTETQRTVNGGRATRLNAFVLVKEAAKMNRPKATNAEWLADYERWEQENRSPRPGLN